MSDFRGSLIELDGQLTGTLSEVNGQVTGVLSSQNETIKGSLSLVSIGEDFPTYDGETIVIPRAYDDIVLATAGTLVETDIVVLNVPMYETSNLAGGTTVYIARE